ncbi:type II CRISPR RNA-guided endonuclease Cas9 [Corynebacterium choanae]|uniref:CRISPR-associated endonuclease Cas9 n=1 Tax=Corynebacterium choanae TaxID=1862358 RepID=A0A3G6J4Z7_9CORY|nr:type II CRISPR RNA-guided endonuclease Cas9 [Corynebacterium choanae]AZA12813.1 CRISPR-associated endonuclease Cas9 [Corynebacterium choanae]
MQVQKRYTVGLDVGSYSLGMAAIELNENGNPVSILSAVSHIHDAGLDPDQVKNATTRLAQSGLMRRTRRLYRERRRRSRKLHEFLVEQQWKTLPFESYADPYHPWRVRTMLVDSYVEDDVERGELLSIALRHIFNHRGWRNPYTRVQSLYNVAEPSENFEQIRNDLEGRYGVPIDRDITVAQLVSVAEFGKDRLRGAVKSKKNGNAKGAPENEVKEAVLSHRLQQSDNAREICRICQVQRIDDDLYKKIIDLVFDAKSPKGAQQERTGKDPFFPKEYRALKASDAFQRYRIASIIGNLRIREDDSNVPLDHDQRQQLFNFLVNHTGNNLPTWQDVAEELGIDRGLLRGTAAVTEDGERANSRPPIHETNRALTNCKVKPLASWWKSEDWPAREALVKALSNATKADFASPAGLKVEQFLRSVDDELLTEIDKLKLPIGRAAYGETTLIRLTNTMLENDLDLRGALEAEFNIPKNWSPPKPPINEPVGNPAVDRVLREAHRWIEAAVSQWGEPESVVVEDTRAGFTSEATRREIERGIEKRTKRNLALADQMRLELGIDGPIRRSDLWRYQSIQRQNAQCAYCGNPITFSASEMDHIVPRAGAGSTNVRENLVATCARCNRAKSNRPFANWARTCGIPGVSVDEAVERTRHWVRDSAMKTGEFKQFVKDVTDRFRRTEYDAPLDARSIESVGWMSIELRSRIMQRFPNARVDLYTGKTTSQARGASGITKHLEFIGGTGKSRLDRRHHAIDAAVIAMMRPYVAETLAIRNNIKFGEFLEHGGSDNRRWKEFIGEDQAHRQSWQRWMQAMHALLPLLQEALDQDRIPVTRNLRLRLGNGAVHKAEIHSLETVSLSTALTVEQIDRAATEALWCALTRHPDFDPKDGLSEDPQRQITVNGKLIKSDDQIELFPVQAASIRVRGGYAQLEKIHHVRFYRVPGKVKPKYFMLRVFVHDLVNFGGRDLFSVELAPQTQSVRHSRKILREALVDGTAEYLGWVVTGDELHLNPTVLPKSVTPLLEEFGHLHRWTIDGFPDERRIRLRSRLLSGEGAENLPEECRKVLTGRGVLTSVNALLAQGELMVVRRDALGRVRLGSRANLPVSWRLDRQ